MVTDALEEGEALQRSRARRRSRHDGGGQSYVDRRVRVPMQEPPDALLASTDDRRAEVPVIDGRPSADAGPRTLDLEGEAEIPGRSQMIVSMLTSSASAK
jgi:hypothetical protein